MHSFGDALAVELLDGTFEDTGLPASLGRSLHQQFSRLPSIGVLCSWCDVGQPSYMSVVVVLLTLFAVVPSDVPLTAYQSLWRWASRRHPTRIVAYSA